MDSVHPFLIDVTGLILYIAINVIGLLPGQAFHAPSARSVAK
jgi:hypothetical protein